jgi:hypothetical protein
MYACMQHNYLLVEDGHTQINSIACSRSSTFFSKRFHKTTKLITDHEIHRNITRDQNSESFLPVDRSFQTPSGKLIKKKILDDKNSAFLAFFKPFFLISFQG